MPVPLFASSLAAHLPRITDRVAKVVASGRYILGPEVEAFERELALYLGVDHVVGVGNGTDALAIALRALVVDSGDEVVVPSFTFFATAEAVAAIGARPVFCDVDPETFCVTAETVEPALGERTRAILPVHLFGNVAPVAELRRFGLPVLEDAAQAAGAALDGRRAGALGDAAALSFFPSKNLGALGDAGAIATSDDRVAERARLLRSHGSRDKVTYAEVAYNSRLDAVQAAALRVLLPELDGWNARRRQVAAAYAEGGLAEHVRLPTVPAGGEHVYHLYVARHPDPETLLARLAARGVEARGYYRLPVHRQPAMAPYLPPGGPPDLPGTEEAAATNLALPMGPELSDEQVAEVIAACASGST
ncbi:MAG TPA: DegT/DnrJ/EryC1/StrS family aminotransferase [Thermoleophilaceae bacterium]|nr:DegT/DnrJ/EryC1/StrS family aminotransferase [Thermoleophilaceae bacterium]